MNRESPKRPGPGARDARPFDRNTPHRKLTAVEKERGRLHDVPRLQSMPWGRSRNGEGHHRWSAGARWDIVGDGARRGRCRRRRLDRDVERKVARQIERKLPLSEEMADQALIGRVATRLGGIVAAIRFRRRAQIVGRAGQSVQARPTQRDQHVARQQRAQQEMSK